MNSNRNAALLLLSCALCFLVIGCSQEDHGSAKTARSAGSDTEVDQANAQSAEDRKRQQGIPVPEVRYLEILKQNSEPSDLRRLLIDFYIEWGRHDGLSAVEHAMANDRTLARFAFQAWRKSDADEPRQWILDQRKGSRRQLSLASEFLHSLPVDDYAARAEWASMTADSSGSAPLVTTVAIAWGKENPDAALRWLSELPAGASRSSGIEALCQAWARSDAREVSSRLNRMQAGPAKDLAISAMAKAIHSDDPEFARLWAETISDSQLRARTSQILQDLASGGLPPTLGF